MANFVNITLDTTAPSTPSISLDGGSAFATDRYVDCTIGTDDTDTTGYMMKIWGDVDIGYDTDVQATEDASSWVSFSTARQISISEGDGQKTIFVRLRDDVHNRSGIVQDSITFDSTKPVVTVTTPDVSKISKIDGRNVASFSFTVDSPFVEYKVKVVNSTGATEDLGTIIPTTNGSVNTSGEGTYDTSTSPITVQITGSDLETASEGDGEKIIKTFVRDEAGLWSS